MHPSHFICSFRAAVEQGLDFLNNNKWLKGRFSQSAFISLARLWVTSLSPLSLSVFFFLRREQALIENSRAVPSDFNITWSRWGEHRATVRRRYFDVEWSGTIPEQLSWEEGGEAERARDTQRERERAGNKKRQKTTECKTEQKLGNKTKEKGNDRDVRVQKREQKCRNKTREGENEREM